VQPLFKNPKNKMKYSKPRQFDRLMKTSFF